MPMNDFSIGKDVVLDLVGETGVLAFTIITGFDAAQMTNRIQVKPLDGIPRFLEIPDGWSGSFDYERRDASIDNYFAALEARYYSGLNVKAITATETITEPSGNVSQFRFEGMMLRLASAGSWIADATVKPKIEWCAGRRIKVL